MTFKHDIATLGGRMHAAYDREVARSLAHHKEREYLKADEAADRAARLRTAWKALEAAWSALEETD